MKYREYDTAALGSLYCMDNFRGYFCTRERGHAGPHAAHGPEKQAVIWSRSGNQCAYRPELREQIVNHRRWIKSVQGAKL